jgi:DNA-binding transcriptional ArsR family regulator
MMIDVGDESMFGFGALLEDHDSDSSERMDEETVDFAADLFSALAHRTRLRIVELLAGDGLTVGQISAGIGLLQPNTSQHLAILQRAGVITSTRHGAQRIYAVRGPRIRRILQLVHEYRHIHREAIVSAEHTDNEDAA